MKLLLTVIKYLMLFISIASPVFQQYAYPQAAYEADTINLGIPLKAHYSDVQRARTAWDVEYFDDKLFVASGDYDKNAGPVPIYHYDFSLKQWINGGTVADEQVEQFNIINGKLTVPGCDPQQEWDYGNIYQFENNQWVTHRNIPGGIHQFDIIEFDNKVFVGLGVLPGNYPIVASSDNGMTYGEVIMYKDGKPIDTTAPADTASSSIQIRVYDFFVLKDTLYAFYTKHLDGHSEFEIYQYRNNGFHYHSDLPVHLSYTRYNYEILKAKAEYDDSLYISTGKLYRTEDMIHAQQIILEEETAVTDLRIIDQKLYVLTVQKTQDNTYLNSVWCKFGPEPDSFRKVFYFTFGSPAQCFTYHNGYFYFGMGDGILSESNPLNGTVLAVHHSAK